jgi:hypothetical protein
VIGDNDKTGEKPMLDRSLRILVLCGALILLVSCSSDPEPPIRDLLGPVPAQTPYVFVTGKPLPSPLRERFGDLYAAQLAVQRDALRDLREQMASSGDTAELTQDTQRLFEVLDALLAEFAGRNDAASLREIGIEPVTRSVFYGLGILPAFRIEIADGERFNALLDRVEQRAGLSAERGTLDDLAYRRIDLGDSDAILAVDGHLFVGGLLPDSLFDSHLPLLLGRAMPAQSLADDGAIDRLIRRHGFSGYGEGYVRLDRLLATLLGKADGLNAVTMQALDISNLPISGACMRLTEALVSGMPRMAIGVSRADEERLVVRGIWESDASVTPYLQRLAAPVIGIGSPHDGLMSMGVGMDLPQVRNAIGDLLDRIIETGDGCEWVEPESLRAVMPQLNLAMGPMTAGLKGFNLQIQRIQIDPQTLQPMSLEAGLLAAVDDPRGVFALAAMFSPELASLKIPTDGTLVSLSERLGLGPDTPPLQVAIHDKSLLILAGTDAATMATALLDAQTTEPAPMLAVDYGVHRLVEELGETMDSAIAELENQGEAEMAGEMRLQLAGFRQQAEVVDRLRIRVFANDQGLVTEQDMTLRR